MAGHSKFKNIMHRKGAQDKKRAKEFARLIREVVVAAKSGLPDPESNPRLRAAIAAAKSANMPKDNIDRAIKRVAGGDESTSYEEIRYEGYGPGGTAIIVEVMTDNRNRAASEVRTAFGKNGGNLGETGSVSFTFTQLGYITFNKDSKDFDAVFEQAVEAGAENVEETEDLFEITSAVSDFAQVRDKLMQVYGDPHEAKIIWHPNTAVDCNEETAAKVIKLIDALEDLDDVQSVFSNFEVSEEIMEKLAQQ